MTRADPRLSTSADTGIQSSSAHGNGNSNGSSNGHGNGATASRPRLGALSCSDYTLITGGVGFIGSNVAHSLLAHGERVLLFDKSRATRPW